MLIKNSSQSLPSEKSVKLADPLRGEDPPTMALEDPWFMMEAGSGGTFPWLPKGRPCHAENKIEWVHKKKLNKKYFFCKVSDPNLAPVFFLTVGSRYSHPAFQYSLTNVVIKYEIIFGFHRIRNKSEYKILIKSVMIKYVLGIFKTFCNLFTFSTNKYGD